MMKPKIVVATLLLAIAMLGIVAFLFTVVAPRSFSSNPSGTSPASDQTDTVTEASIPQPEAQVTAPELKTADNAVTNTVEVTGPPREDYIRQRVEELGDLAMKDDVTSRDAILAELQNPEKEIREAALSAAIEFNDRSVVPRLQEVANQTKDSAEKAKIFEAIDYINLPSLTERLASRQQSIH
jgi:hypothetical protein